MCGYLWFCSINKWATFFFSHFSKREKNTFRQTQKPPIPMIVRLSDNRHPAVDCLYRIFVYGVWVRWFDAFVCGHCCGREDMVCLSSGANTVSAHRCTPQINYEQKKNFLLFKFFFVFLRVFCCCKPLNATDRSNPL